GRTSKAEIIGAVDEPLDQRLTDLTGMVEVGPLGEAGPARLDRAAAEPVVRDALAADDVEQHFLAVRPQPRHELLRGTDRVGVVRPAQPPVARDEQYPGPAYRVARREQRVVETGVG